MEIDGHLRRSMQRVFLHGKHFIGTNADSNNNNNKAQQKKVNVSINFTIGHVQSTG